MSDLIVIRDQSGKILRTARLLDARTPKDRRQQIIDRLLADALNSIHAAKES